MRARGGRHIERSPGRAFRGWLSCQETLHLSLAFPADGGGALVILRWDDGGSGTPEGDVRAHISRAQGWKQGRPSGGRVDEGQGAEVCGESPGIPGTTRGQGVAAAGTGG